MYLALVDTPLRGVSQVFLAANPLSGLLILIALALSSPSLVLGAVVGSMSSSLACFLLTVGSSDDDKEHHTFAIVMRQHILAGLAGYDGALVGCSLSVFFSYGSAVGDSASSSSASTGTFILTTVLLSSAAAFIHLSFTNFCNRLSLPSFTIAFNIVMASYILATTNRWATVQTMATSAAAPLDCSSAPTDNTACSLDFLFFVHATLLGVGQFMFVDTLAGALLVVAAIAICEWRAALAALAGALLSALSCLFVLQLPDAQWGVVRAGLYGYNAAGCAAALSGRVFFKTGARNAVFGCVCGSLLVTLMQVGLKAVFATAELPLLTFPFVLTTWLMMATQSTHIQKLNEE